MILKRPDDYLIDPARMYTLSPPTPIHTLKKATEIDRCHGLHWFYFEYVSGQVDTHCPDCEAL